VTRAAQTQVLLAKLERKGSPRGGEVAEELCAVCSKGADLNSQGRPQSYELHQNLNR